MTVEQLASKFSLKHTHNLVLESGGLVFKSLSASGKHASVYVWLACKPQGEYKVLYVGKAGKGVDLRCAQHMGGFVNSGTGRKNATELIRYLSDGFEVRVYARKSNTLNIFGLDVSLYAAEEDALCEALNPVLNRAVFPSIGVSEKKQSDIGEVDQTVRRTQIVEELINSRLIHSTAVSSDDLFAQLAAYNDDQRASIEKLLVYAEKSLSPAFRAKLVGGYAGHPRGCSGQTTLTYAIPGPSGKMKQGTWRARVYFGAQPRVGLPLARLKSTAVDKVDIADRERTFSPKSTDAFIQNPDDYFV